MKPLDCLPLYDDAAFYDLEFATRGQEIPFFLKHAGQAGGAVLEVACGTGRLTLPLARAGIDVTGLDVSQPMLDLAARKATEAGLSIAWLQQDCRTMELPRRYALVFSATNAMQHLHDIDSVSAFLAAARTALAPGGRLILDVFNPDPVKLARDASVRYLHKVMGDGADRIRVEAESQYQAAEQLFHFRLFYWQRGFLLRTKEVNMRCFFPQELLALCRMQGLVVEQRFGNYDESPFTSSSPKQILLCRGKT